MAERSILGTGGEWSRRKLEVRDRTYRGLYEIADWATAQPSTVSAWVLFAPYCSIHSV